MDRGLRLFLIARLFRLPVMAWLSLWMVAVPLIHIHPEADHHHGERSHVHGGLAHTVFSVDLPCEYRVHSSVASHQQSVTGQTGHDANHLELAFAVLAGSIDKGIGKSALVSICVVTSDIVVSQFPKSSSLELAAPAFASVFLTQWRSTRAPPVST